MRKLTCLILILTVLFFSCKKNNNSNTWTEQDQIFYDNVIALQDQAAENYTVWMQTMDSLEVINQLQQFFMDDSTVTSATIGSQGIAVQYSNGMRGGIFLNPEDYPGGDTLNLEPLPNMPSSNLNEKSLVNSKKAIFINPHHWDRAQYANWIVQHYNYWLRKAGFNLDSEVPDASANVNVFTQLSGYGLIHIYSHGWAWPKETNIAEVYLMTGEIVNANTTEAYQEEIKNGNILLGKARTSTSQISNVYWITEKFVAAHNNFSNDTVLFYGGFCYSFLGEWPEIEKTFAEGAYFGFDWSVYTNWNAQWAVALSDSLCDTSARAPFNPEKWINGPVIPKSYWSSEANKTVHIWYAGDAELTFWKDSASSDVFSIGQNYGGGIIFYIDGTGKHGLISATTYQATYVPWGCEGTLIGATSTSIGTGQANTTAIVNACSDADIAARICDDLVLNGYSDWFLPSKDEMYQMYLQRNLIGGFGSNTYWSSSEIGTGNAWSQAFIDGTPYEDTKHFGNYVRAVRSF